jgi:alpha-L-rhamnosidase
VLGRKAEAARYRGLSNDIKAAFNRAFVQPDGWVQGDTQAGYALALNFDLLPEALCPLAALHMVEAVHRYEDHVATGIQTTHRLILELTRHGCNDIAWQLLTNRTFPSWGYMIENGATTMWERWDGYVKGRGFQDPGMNSFNHWALGSVGEWMYRNILGLNPDEQQPGWKRFTIRPRPGGGVTWARGHYDSIRGRILVEWKLEGERFSLNATVPANASAFIWVPAKAASAVTEGVHAYTQFPGGRFLRMEEGAAVFEVGSGTYQFVSQGRH